MDEPPICPEWWPQMLWKLHFPHPRPGPGPGPINFPPAIDDMMAALTMHSLSYMLLDRAAAENVRRVTEATLAETARNLGTLHATAIGAGTREAVKGPAK